MPRLPTLGLCLLGLSLVCGSALAGPRIAVLAFGGDQGTEVRDVLVAALAKRYEVVHGQKLLDACDRLGITMSRGKNLARAAAEVGTVAVVGGTMKAGHLVLAVYSGKTGQPLAAGTVRFGGEVDRPMLAQTLALILKGLKKAPKNMPRPRGQPEPVAPKPEPRPRPVAGAGGSKAGEGEAGGESGGGSLSYDPNAPDNPNLGAGAAAVGSGAGGGASPGGGSGVDENPLAPRPAPVAPPPATGVQASGPPRPTRIQGLLGLGSWMRSFSMNDAAPGPAPPRYDGSAFTLRLDLRLYPVSFFLTNWPAGFLIHLQYQQALGLSSTSVQPGPTGGESVNRSFGTTLRQLLLGFGYDWKILPDRALSPHLELKLGYGMLDFAIEWDESAVHNLPAVAYRFFLVDLGARYDVWSWLGAHLNFDYRALSGSGEIEDDENWYGAAKTGGINLGLGVHGGWKGITASADYSYTRYFYAFIDPQERQKDPLKRVAGGALDIMHTLMLSAGYAF